MYVHIFPHIISNKTRNRPTADESARRFPWCLGCPGCGAVRWCCHCLDGKQGKGHHYFGGCTLWSVKSQGAGNNILASGSLFGQVLICLAKAIASQPHAGHPNGATEICLPLPSFILAGPNFRVKSQVDQLRVNGVFLVNGPNVKQSNQM